MVNNNSILNVLEFQNIGFFSHHIALIFSRENYTRELISEKDGLPSVLELEPLALSPVPECHRLTRAKCLITPSL